MKKPKKTRINPEIEILVSVIDNIMISVNDMNNNAKSIASQLTTITNQIKYLKSSTSKPNIIDEQTQTNISNKIADKIIDQYTVERLHKNIQNAFEKSAKLISNTEIKVRWSSEDEGVKRLLQNTEDKIDKLNTKLNELNNILR